MIKPPRLLPGDRIDCFALLCSGIQPAGGHRRALPPWDSVPSLEKRLSRNGRLRRFGTGTRRGFQRDGQGSGHPDDPLFRRGSREMRSCPRWIMRRYPGIGNLCSYSDGTNILNAAVSRSGVPAYYGQDWYSLLVSEENREIFREAFCSGAPPLFRRSAEWRVLRRGKAEGILIGGYLANFALMVGSGIFFPPDKRTSCFWRITFPLRRRRPSADIVPYCAKRFFPNGIRGAGGPLRYRASPELDAVLARFAESFGRPAAWCGDLDTASIRDSPPRFACRSGHGGGTSCVSRSVYPVSLPAGPVSAAPRTGIFLCWLFCGRFVRILHIAFENRLDRGKTGLNVGAAADQNRTVPGRF